MKRHEEFSEEQLNAFVDDELDPEEKSRLYNAATHSTDLDQRLCQQRRMKELVKHAYDKVPAPTRPKSPSLSRGGFLGRALAASILLIVGLSGGMLVHQYLDSREGPSGMVAAPAAKVGNYLLHVTSGDPQQMYAALRQAQQLLESAEGDEVRQVEIIANERGLDLVRSDVTPFSREISALQARNVVFYACSRTIERLEQDGVEVTLVPQTNADYTALDRVVTRMQEGWQYEKI
jgi:intracellular sulfur oxidation DsrE/DsrF family protein